MISTREASGYPSILDFTMFIPATPPKLFARFGIWVREACGPQGPQFQHSSPLPHCYSKARTAGPKARTQGTGLQVMLNHR
ncbi:hypothetical protein PAHAL_4G110600 [Panicum hallii]|uniref:Uncharacterized protein n=1 Tax=Panicum hallii TaxID=206008 RepID=A0A2T8JCL4_9POAL|nr:hypothetical protein PAHAL_4G110600 [Panicum hallii]